MIRSSQSLRGAWASWLVALAIVGVTRADNPPTLTIQGDERTLGETPLIIECRQDLKVGPRHLVSLDGKSKLEGQVYQDGGKTFLAVVLENLSPREARTYKIEEYASPDGIQEANLLLDGPRVSFQINGKVVTEYIPNDGPKPYYYPLVGPSNAWMTRSFPMKKVEGEKLDHPHHRSLWFTHGSVNKVDFWSEAPGHGRIVETSRKTVALGPALISFRTLDDWNAPDGKKIVEDERTLNVYVTKKVQILDFDVKLKASEGPVTFGDTKEGMFGLRVATSMDVTAKKGGKIVNAEGVKDAAAWGKPSPWVDYSGPVGGKTVGVAILNHPSSFRYPTTWHVRDYGLFAANPFGWHDFGQKTSGEYILPKGEAIEFRYRVILHDGDTASAGLPSAFQTYEAPPKAVIE